MKKNACVVVSGYIFGEIYKEVSEALSEYHPVQAHPIYTGIHIYPYSSEGAISHLCTNYPLPEGSEVGYILSQASDVDMQEYDKGNENAGLAMYDQPTMLEAYAESPDMLYLGSLLGYDEDGIERYEA